MRRPAALAVPVAAALALSACAGGKVKEQKAEIESLQVKGGELLGQVKERDDRISRLESEKADLEGQAQDLASKLNAAQARIDSLVKSNKDLSLTIEAKKGELSGKVKELISEKDELSRKLADLQKVRIAAERGKTGLAGQLERAKRARDRAAKELETARGERDAFAEELTKLRADGAKSVEERRARLARAREGLGELADAVLKEIQAGGAKVSQQGETLLLTLQEPLLFEPAEAKLTPGGRAVLDRVARALARRPGRDLRVEGHTDNAPLKSGLLGGFGGFGGLWELSTARATAVARYLHEHGGITPRRLTAAGFGEFRPAAGNDTEAGRASNRRMVLSVSPAPEPAAPAPSEE